MYELRAMDYELGAVSLQLCFCSCALSYILQEFGLVGSTEFVETHYSTLYHQAVAYLNLDVAVTGGDWLDIDGSPSFGPILKELIPKIPVWDVAAVWLG